VVCTALRAFRLALLALGLVAAAATVAAAGEPTDVLRDFFSAVNHVLADPRTEDQPLEKLKAIRREVDRVFDFREAAMLALGREWTAQSAVDQHQFVVLFADLLERSFVWRMAGKASIGGGLKVKYLGETLAGDTATVDTAVAARDGSDLRLEYRMVRRAGRWVVRDVVMDGVSTMENYHAQFQRVVRDGSWGDLLAQLRAKVGAPPVALHVATPAPGAAPAAVPTAPAPRPLSSPLTPAELGRSTQDARLAARDVAPPPTTTVAVRDVGPLAPPRPRATLVTEPTLVFPQSRESVPAREASVTTPDREVARPPAGDAGRTTPTGLAAPTPTVAAKPSTGRSAAAYWIQVGAFRSAADAERTAARVKGEIFVAEAPTAGNRQPLFRVRVGPFKERTGAHARLRQLKALGYKPFLAASN
jgi:ABC-type transporter MlaC component/cell division septation protein DedD